ncbi:cap-specific mRNA (nucleoside-2'-O-)-methyltransferase 2 [Pelobates fuscus]|uniref:cap-specific mRNA (nucleoside-2'-O-)-methyltransferase 2 n=1 Tax=Pelobates fuscus TaxID=191477 RepID=UPI002FE43589
MLKCDIATEIQALFNKRFQYVKETDWVLPDLSEAFICEHEEFSALQVFKSSLNQVKNLLSDKKLDDWHRHTSFTNRAGKIVSEVRKCANAELCTQAWCKFHEIVCSYPLLPLESLWNKELNTIHICEAPGAFVSSLNHFLKSQDRHCDWNWVANTLNPYHEANDGLVMIADDRLIANTLPWWFFGPDNTGDIMSLKHLFELQHFTSNMSTVHLVTADGSFDCQGNPGEQESLVSPLHYCEVVTCLMLLGQGGSFVLKMFTLFEHSSVNLMYFLNCCFDQVHVIKPGTSKAGNSEVYIVCLGYLGKDALEGLLSKMTENFGKQIVTKSLFPQKSIPASFLRCHKECCDVFYKHQTETIMENLNLFSCMGEQEKFRLNELRDYAVKYYIRNFHVKRIPRKQWLVKNPQFGCSVNSRWVGVRACRSESFNERKQLEMLSWAEKVANGFFSPWLKEHVQKNLGADCFLQLPYDELKTNEWFIVEGKQLARIHSSPFCDSRLIKCLNETIDECFTIISMGPEVFPSCPMCSCVTEEAVCLELLRMSKSREHFIVCGAHSLFQFLNAKNIPCDFIDSPLDFRSLSVLHDGDPAYQKVLLTWILQGLQQTRDGGSLVLPILSSFTRFTASIVYILYHCFELITFTCPTSSLAVGTDAILICSGFNASPAPTVDYLFQLMERTEELRGSGVSQQVLEFIPMEALLQGPLLAFLWTLNTAILEYRLHVFGQLECEKACKKQSNDIPQNGGQT